MNWLKKIFGIKEIRWAHYDKKEEIMTVTYDDGTQNKYFGECTVWHHYPLMERCATSTELQLYNIWTYIKRFGNNYPDAHKTSKNHEVSTIR